MKWKFTKRELLGFMTNLYAVLTLFVMSRPLRQLMVVEGVDVQFWMVVGLYCIILPFILRRPKRFIWVASRDKLLLFLVCLVLLSIVWSVDPKSTLKNSITLFGGTFFGIYLAMRYSLREQMYVFAWTLGLAAVLSLIVALAFPAVGTHTAGGETGVWSGIYDRKNGLGRYMAISAILFWILRMDSKKKWILWVSFSFSVGLILLARSATALVALVVTLGLMPLYKALRWRDTRAVPVFISAALLVASIVIIVVAANPDASSDLFFSVLGRDPNKNTLQLRIALWEVVLSKVQQRSLLGYGFGDSWVQAEGGTSLVWYRYAWEVEQAHNGYLEILLQLGLVGLMAMVYHLLLDFRRGIMLTRLAKTTEGFWALAYLTMLSLFNLTSSIFLGQLTVPWTIYVALTLSMCVQLDQTNVVSVKRKQFDTIHESVSAYSTFAHF